MKTIVIASQNPVKIQATLGGFQKFFPEYEFEVQTVSVPSGVRDQPMSDGETLKGAMNRASLAQTRLPKADYWVGIEGGVEIQDDEMAVFAWIVVKSNAITGKGKTGTFYIPPILSRLVQEGKELGEADDFVFKRSNSKQENGAIGILTNDLVDRRSLYEMAVIFALLPFKNHNLYAISNSQKE